MLNLSKVIRLWRKSTGLTLQEASQELGVAKSVLARVEVGEKQGLGKGSGIDGSTLATIMRWLLDHSRDLDESTVTTAHDRQDRQKKAKA